MRRKPIPNEPPLCTADEAIALAERASTLSAERWSPAWERESRRRQLLRVRATYDAFLVALEVATDTGDPRVLAAALDGADKAARWDRMDGDDAFAFAVLEIVPKLDNIPNRLRECAASRSPDLRAAVATSLGPRALRSLRREGDDVDAEASGIVAKLANDKDASVRQAARAALLGMAPPAWASFYPRDPLAALPAPEAARLRGPLDRAAEALEIGVRGGTAKLVAAVAELPDELAMPLLEAWIRTESAMRIKGSEPLIDRWLRCDTDGARLCAWLQQSRDDRPFGAEEPIAAALARADEAHATILCLAVLGRLRSLLKRDHMAFHAAECVLRAGWPRDADRRPLLEAALGAPLERAALEAPESRDKYDQVAASLLEMVLAPGPGFAPLCEPLITAFEQGMPGCWRVGEPTVSEALLGVRDPRLRRLAEQRITSDERANITWALRYLTDVGHEPDVDPPVDRILRSATRQPYLRDAILHSSELVTGPAKRHLRALLVAGELPPEEAVEFAVCVRDDGLTTPEWAAVRNARDELTGVVSLSRAISAVPEAAHWTDSDRAFFERMIRDHGEDDRVGVMLGLLIKDNASPERLPMAEALLARVAPAAREFVEHAIAACKAKAPALADGTGS